MRTKNVFLNLTTGVFSKILSEGAKFFIRQIFLHYLAVEYLGVNNLFNNILVMVSIAEGGASGVFETSLYVPLFQKNWEKVNALFYAARRFFLGCALFVFILGLVCIPFFYWVIGSTNIENILYLYSLFFLSMIINYLFSHYVCLLGAAQKRYLYTIYNCVLDIIGQVLQIAALVFFRSFELFILIQTVCRVIPFFILRRKGKLELSEVFEIKPVPLDVLERKSIRKNMYAGFWVHFSNCIFNGTDTIIITKVLGLYIAGLYGNYIAVMALINGLLQIFVSSIHASVGEYVAEKDAADVFVLFKKILCLYMFLVFLAFGSFFILINPFISVWLGTKYLLEQSMVLCMALIGVFSSYGFYIIFIVFKWASCLYTKDKYCYALTSAVNIILSIVLGTKFGINGILAATVIASLIIDFSSIYIVVKYLFKVKLSIIFIDLFCYLVLLPIPVVIAYVVMQNFVITNFLTFVIAAICCVCSMLFGMILLNLWRAECRYYLVAVFSKIKSISKR